MEGETKKPMQHNHGLMMLLCCVVPLLLLIGAVYMFGLSKSYLYWFFLLSCPLMHVFMMKDMHKGKGLNSKEKGGCH